ncbi:prestin isoform X1 [Cydia amplana]|uniref:prestin isoform X1 n=1 Tax=Cydia amplana TaxID=1869771 RepID=UPI002FE50D40
MRNGKRPSIDEEKEELNPEKNGWVRVRSSQQFNVVRRVYQQDALNEDADYHEPVRPWKYHLRKCIRDCGIAQCVCGILPIIDWLPKYKIKEYAIGDLTAGATTAVMHIPQGMAYAMLAEVAPVAGLYMAFFPVLIYVLFGTSPHISLGTFAVACLMSGKVVSTYARMPDIDNISNITNVTNVVTDSGNGSMEYTPEQVLSVVCLTVGIMQTCMWIFRLGAVSTLLSEPLVSGFTTGAAFIVIASQLKDLFGIRIPKLSGNHKVVLTVIEVCKALPNTNVAAVTISFLVCLVIALNNELFKPWVAKRSRVPVPIELLAIVIGTLVTKFSVLKEKFGIALVGEIPTGLPTPFVPPLELMPSVAVDSITITMVTYTISMSMALIFAARDKYEVDSNQELLALGASNLMGSFFCCAPICASLSRSYIQYQAGAKTNLTQVVSALLILCVLLFLGPFFEDLPRCVLASIIVVSLKGMLLQVLDLKRFCYLSKLDAAVWLITFLMTTLVNIDYGLVAGLLASVGALFIRSQKPYTCLLGRVLETDLYLDIKRYRAAEELPGIKIFHYCGGLNFATKNLFRETLFRKVGYMKPIVIFPEDQDSNNGTLTKSESYVWDPSIGKKVHCVIIDASALSYVDAPGVKTLVVVSKELEASNIMVLLAGANGPMLEMIHRYNELETTNQLRIDTFPTVHDAVVYYKVLEAKRGDNTVPVTING